MPTWFNRTPPELAPPAHFPEPFRDTWRELVAALGNLATPDRRFEVELATLLLEDLRTSTPDDWTPERFTALAAILRGLRT